MFAGIFPRTLINFVDPYSFHTVSCRSLDKNRATKRQHATEQNLRETLKQLIDQLLLMSVTDNKCPRQITFSRLLKKRNVCAKWGPLRKINFPNNSQHFRRQCFSKWERDQCYQSDCAAPRISNITDLLLAGLILKAGKTQM